MAPAIRSVSFPVRVPCAGKMKKTNFGANDAEKAQNTRCGTEIAGEQTMSLLVNRRRLLRSSLSLAAAGVAGGGLAAPALIGRAEAAVLKLKLSSSQANDPRFANGRVYYDNLMKQIAASPLAGQIEIAFFPDNQLGQEIDVINSVKLGVIDMMVSGSSIAANLVPLVGTYDLGYLFTSFPQQTKAFEAGAAGPIEQALLKGANIRIIAWAYNFGSRSVLARKAVNAPEDLSSLKIRTLPNPVITECLRLMGAAATPMAFGEIYTALQAGVLDGLEHDPPTIVASKFYETSKFYSLTQHNFSPLAIYLSETSFNRMPAGLREAFVDVAKKAAADTRAHGLNVEKEALAQLREKGVTVIDCDREAFRKRVAPQTEAFIKARPEAKPVIDLIRATSL
jgi:TRAP-type transport system periplasmic protein